MAKKPAQKLQTGDVIHLKDYGRIIARNVRHASKKGHVTFHGYNPSGSEVAVFEIEYAVTLDYRGNVNHS